MRVIIIATACLLLLAAAPVHGESTTVGNCDKLSGGCATVCVDLGEACWNEGAACVGVSDMVPQCLPKLD